MMEQISREALAEVAHHGVDMLIERIRMAESNTDLLNHQLSSEMRGVNRRQKQINRIRELHRRISSESDIERCSHCIASYDRFTRKLIHAAWPCPTAQVLAEQPS